MKIPAPNHTQTPNICFDELFKTLKEGELRVILVLIRQTFGWHKTFDRISLSKLAEKSGMNRPSVCRSLNSLIEKNLVEKKKFGCLGQERCYYSLVMESTEQEDIPEDDGIETEEEMAIISNSLYQSPKETGVVSLGDSPSLLKRLTKETSSKTSSKHTYIKEHVPEAKNLPSFSEKNKNLDSAIRWKLSEIQKESFYWLKSQGIDSDDGKLAWWSKTYPIQRLMDAFYEAKAAIPKSLGAYISTLLQNEAVLNNANSIQNREFATQYREIHGWNQLKMLKKYVRFPLGVDSYDLSLNMDPQLFAQTLIQKHQI